MLNRSPFDGRIEDDPKPRRWEWLLSGTAVYVDKSKDQVVPYFGDKYAECEVGQLE